MYKLKFDTGEVVTFQNEPTDSDIEEVVNKLGIKPKGVTVPKDSIQPTQRSMAADVAIGAGKGVVSSATNTSGLLNKIGGIIPQSIKSAYSRVFPGQAGALKAVSAVAPAVSGLESRLGMEQGALSTPTNTAQKVGYYGEKAAEFLIPTGVGAKIAKPAVGRSFIKAGEKIQNIVISPKEAAIKGGFDIKNVTKYDLAGPLEKALPKTTETLKNLRTELDNVIKLKKDIPTLNLKTALESLKQEFKGKGLKQLGQKGSIDKTIKSIENELDAIIPNWKNKKINFGDAIDAKRAAGLNSSFLHGQLKTGLTAEEKVWNNLYKILQRETEKAAKGTRFEQINKKISEIIPIEQAMLKRIPVAERNNVIGLNDMIAFGLSSIDPKAISLGIANRLLKSGTVARGLIKTGQALSK